MSSTSNQTGALLDERVRAVRFGPIYGGPDRTAAPPVPALPVAALHPPSAATGSECPDCWTVADTPHICACECGTALDVHPPLPRPGPLASPWRVRDTDQRMASNRSSAWNGARRNR